MRLREAAIELDDAGRAEAARAEFLLAPFIAFLNRAWNSARQKKSVERRIWLEAAGELFSMDDFALNRLTLALTGADRGAEALKIAGLIAELDPRNARAHFRLARVRQSLGDNKGAIAPLERALALEPDLPLARNNLAAALIQAGERPEAVMPLLEAAVAADPNEVEAWINLASRRRQAFDLPAALEAGARAVELAPDNILALTNYALALEEAERWDDAEVIAARALTLSGGAPLQHLNYGLMRLRRGDYAAGWAGFERRWESTAERFKTRPVLPGPPWRGEPLLGKTLLVWGEEGNGDVLQFARYIPMLADHVHAQGGRLVWNAFPAFGDLLKRSFERDVDAYVTGGIPLLPPFDYEFPLLSAGRLLNTTGQTIPAAVPYLTVEPGLSAAWRHRLAGETRLRVGLAWTGRPDHVRNPFRRVDLGRFAQRLGGLKNVAFYALQLGATAEVEAERAAGFDIVDPTGEFQSFDDTAALVENLDLVITICTSVAHLAGALGKPTWVVLDVNPHWVWGLDKAETPWYPTARLYRQRAFRDWDPVLRDVAHDLEDLARRRP